MARERAGQSSWPALLPVGYALLLSIYTGLRYGYRWAEIDTATFLGAIRSVTAAGTIEPSGGAYQHGFGYQAIVIALAEVTGLGHETLLLVVLPFLAMLTALAAFLAFRALLGRPFIAAVAALLLFVQPEFVFVLQRGNHEKVTHALLLLLVFLLTTSLARRGSASNQAGYVITFYLLAWTVISINAFFGSSFLASMVLALVGGIVIFWRWKSADQELRVMRRLTYGGLACFVLLFIFIEYVYAPVQSNFRLFQTLIERLALLFLSFDAAGTPYQTVITGQAWVTPWLYPVLSSFNWALTLVAAITWLWLFRRLHQRTVPIPHGILLLWLLTAAFAVEVGLSIIVDFAGFLGENLQIRLFPLFMFFAIPLTVYGLAEVARRRSPAMRYAIGIVAVCLIAFFATVGILKATNDPLVSNKWLFFSQAEQRALHWTDQSLERQAIWIGFDERLRTMQIIHDPLDPEQGNRYRSGRVEETERYFIMSDIIARRSIRLQTPAPAMLNTDRIYDNGAAQIYHRVPRTPYQP